METDEQYKLYQLIQSAVKDVGLHTQPAPQTLQMFQDLKENIHKNRESYLEHFEKIDTKLEAILIQATKTNGRVNKHDEELATLKEATTDVASVKSDIDKKWTTVKVAGGVFFLLATLLGGAGVLYVKDIAQKESRTIIKEEVPKVVQSALQDLDIEATIKK